MKMEKSVIKLPKKYTSIIIGLIFIGVYYWALRGTETSVVNFLEGVPYFIDFTTRMFPPDFTNFNLFFSKTIETLQMAIMGTSLGTIIALPLSFLAARNVMSNKIIYNFIRGFFDMCRGINEIVWGLIFVSMVGLGPFPGVLALTAHVTGALGRYFSESIETVNPEIIKAIISTGANKFKTIVCGIIPQVKPLFMNYILYYLENNFRAATVLGLVGAGGIGMELITSIRLFKNKEVLAILIIMISTVIVIDRISAHIRKKLVGVKIIQ